MDIVQKVLLTLLVGLFVTLLIFFVQTGQFSSSSSRSPYYKPSFLILGSNNAGKTALYHRLIDESEEREKKLTPTVSSIEMSATDINLPFANRTISKKFQLIDFPGHVKYSQLLNKLIVEDITLTKVRGVIYVIDSSSRSAGDLELSSQFLFNLLSITEKLQNGVDFLFAVNKSEAFDSIPVHRIRQLLEDEINKLVQNELNSVDKNSGIDKADDGEFNIGHETLREFWLSVVGSSKGKFTFDKLEGNMDFVAGSALTGKIDGWENWLDEKVVN